MKKLLVALGTIPVFILTTFADGEIETALSTALTGIKTDVTGVIATVAPIAVSIMGIFLVWKYGLRFFKTISRG